MTYTQHKENHLKQASYYGLGEFARNSNSVDFKSNYYEKAMFSIENILDNSSNTNTNTNKKEQHTQQYKYARDNAVSALGKNN